MKIKLYQINNNQCQMLNDKKLLEKTFSKKINKQIIIKLAKNKNEN